MPSDRCRKPIEECLLASSQARGLAFCYSAGRFACDQVLTNKLGVKCEHAGGEMGKILLIVLLVFALLIMFMPDDPVPADHPTATPAKMVVGKTQYGLINVR